MNRRHLDPALERRAIRLECHKEYRVLRKVPSPFSNFPDDGAPPDGKCVGIVDLETTGLDAANDAIIELALMLVWLNDDDEVISHIGPFSWLEDPGVLIEPKITLVTGLSNHHLLGKKIPDKTVVGMLSRADILVSHNAKFEIDFLERRYPSLAHAPWGCSVNDIDWLMADCDGRAQGHLLAQHGWFSDAHRAGPDVWSLFWLLTQRRRGVGPSPVRTHFQRLLETVETDTMMIEARGAPFSKKDLLKARQYRWNADGKFWHKELSENDVADEQAWHFQNGMRAPTLRAITAHQRHR